MDWKLTAALVKLHEDLKNKTEELEEEAEAIVGVTQRDEEFKSKLYIASSTYRHAMEMLEEAVAPWIS